MDKEIPVAFDRPAVVRVKMDSVRVEGECTVTEEECCVWDDCVGIVGSILGYDSESAAYSGIETHVENYAEVFSAFSQAFLP